MTSPREWFRALNAIDREREQRAAERSKRPEATGERGGVSLAACSRGGECHPLPDRLGVPTSTIPRPHMHHKPPESNH